MSNAWYETFFSENYWKFVETQTTAEQTAAEIVYLRDQLRLLAPGRRVVDLGCGIGRHAIGLAQAGFEVTGLDISPWVIGAAQQRTTGVDVRWEILDLLSANTWPLAEIDAAICIDSFGWGSDADQRRFLRQIRRRLAPNGVLILACPNLHWAIQHPAASGIAGAATYELRQTYDCLGGRLQGTLTTVPPGQAGSFDQRLYAPSELIALVREAGFVVEHVGADFDPILPLAVESRWLQVCARALPTPPVALAVTSWRTSDEERLDLRYAPDEAVWLDPSPDVIWEAVVKNENHLGAEAVGYYPVNDPYGGERAASTVAQYFGCTVREQQLTFGSGVTSLLHDLCGLADGGLIVAPQWTHPDLTAWAMARGAPVYLVEELATPDSLISVIRRQRPSLVQLDRPNFVGELMPPDALYWLAAEAANVGAVVLVDESPATYFGPQGSAASLVERLDNLVVLRGLTKAYSWGGSRVGLALASNPLSARVRELVAPLQVGELAYRATLKLLEAGDIFGRLRARIHTTKPVMVSLLRDFGLEVMEGHPDLPWIALPDPGSQTSKRLDRLGIRGLRFVPSPALRGPYPERLILFSPLTDERMALLRQRLDVALQPANP